MPAENLFNPSDPGVGLLARAVQDVPPSQLALVYSGPLPGLRPGATRWALDVREQDPDAPATLVAPWAVDTTPRFQAATVWPRAHLGKDFSEACLALAAAVLVPGGRLHCAVRKDKGAASLARTIAAVCGSCETAARDRGYFLLVAEKTDRYDAAAASALLATRYEIAEPLLGAVPLLSAPGVFSRKHLDDGTRALLTELAAAPLATPRRIIDLGAGVGPLSLWAAQRWPKGHVLAVESNVIAAALVRENAQRLGCERVEVALSDGLPASHPWQGTVDLALVNPPTHAPPEAFAALVKPLPRWLRPGGEAWFVVNRSGRLLGILEKEMRAAVETHEVPGFWIVRARWG